MGNALARLAQDEACPPGAQETALRLALEEARRLAAQSRLLALNAAFEAAGPRSGAEEARAMDALGAEAGRAVAETEMVAAAVELILQQIRSAAAFKPL